jgi:hypothetical protein
MTKEGLKEFMDWIKEHKVLANLESTELFRYSEMAGGVIRKKRFKEKYQCVIVIDELEDFLSSLEPEK